MSTLVVNLYGQPGAGKSTCAAYVFSRLKMAGINCELVTEFAKDKTWEDNTGALSNQLYVAGEQSYRLSRCNGKVDVIITDSPLPLSIIYKSQPELGENFDKTIMDMYNSFENISYYLKRVKAYNPAGRSQTEAESDALAGKIMNMLLKQNIHFKTINGDIDGCNYIVSDIYEKITGQPFESEEIAHWVPDRPLAIQTKNDEFTRHSDFHCSNCNYYPAERNYHHLISSHEYCPRCGKKMKPDNKCFLKI